MKGCPNARGKSCKYWKPLGSNDSGALHGCHYCLEHKHSRSRDANDNCLSFVEGHKTVPPKEQVVRMTAAQAHFIKYGRVDHRIKAVKMK